MTSKYSVYAVAESDPPKWLPGEDLAASAIIAVTFYLVLEVQFEIWRAFTQRKGLYFWSIELGVWGCALDAIGISMKYLARKTKTLWPLETLFILGGWSIYSTAQLLILYSRLHFVCRRAKIQRAVFWMIIVTTIAFQIPSWVVVWPGYADIPRISSEWSPRDAIVERFNQLGYTMAEAIISGIYIKSLVELLKVKSSVRQRRVMMDLIYVNILVVASDLLEMVLVWLNINGLSHPIQTFSYILKFRLEFVVLNQLMAVAARGLYKESYEERRYHHPSTSEGGSRGKPMRLKGSQPPAWSDEEKYKAQAHTTKVDSLSEVHVPKPQPTHRGRGSSGSLQISLPSSPHLSRDRTRSRSHEPHLEEVSSHMECQGLSPNTDEATASQCPPNDSSSAEINLPLQDFDNDDATRHSWLNAFRGRRSGGQSRRAAHSTGERDKPMKAKVKSRPPTAQDLDNYYDEEGEIALHMWEQKGEIVLQVPWLKSTDKLDV